MAIIGCVGSGASGARDDGKVTSDFGDRLAVATTASDGSVTTTLLRKVDGERLASLAWASGSVTWDVAGVSDASGATHTFVMPGESSPFAANDLVDTVWKFASDSNASLSKQDSAITCSGQTEGTFELDGFTCLATCTVLEDCTTITRFSCVAHN
jgi:hypothetical protein